MSENAEKCPSQFPTAQGDIFKLLVLTHQQSESQMHSDIQQRKAANHHNLEAATSKCLINNFLKIKLNNNQNSYKLTLSVG